MADYNYSITNDFPNQAVDLPVLGAQINAAITPPPTLEGIGGEDDTITISFSDDLSPGQVTTLNGVVASHQGQPFVETTQSVSVESEQTTTSTTYTNAATLTSGPLAGGTYILTWYCEGSVALSTAQAALAQVMWNGTERASSVFTSDFYGAFSGTLTVEGVPPLATPTFAVNYRRVGLASTARIRRIRLSIVPLQG